MIVGNISTEKGMVPGRQVKKEGNLVLGSLVRQPM